RPVLAEAVTRLEQVPDRAISLTVLEAVAGLVAAARPAAAAVLLTAATTMRKAFQMPAFSYERRTLASLEERLAAPLGEHELARARAAGAGMTLEAAMTSAATLLETANE